MGLNRIRRAGGEKASGPFAFSGCDKIPAHEMKIISIPTSEVPQPRRRTPWNNWFFEHEEGVIDQDGVFMCPICGCCSLKPVSFSEANKQRCFRMTGDLVWVCVSGCTKTKSHAHRTRHRS